MAAPPSALALLDTPALVRDVLWRAGEGTDSSSDFYERALDYLNRAQLTVAAGAQEFAPDLTVPWRWYKATQPAVLILEPAIGATLQCTHGSLTATLTSPSGSGIRDVTGEMFTGPTLTAWPRVASMDVDRTVVTWDAPWVDPTASVTGAFWKLDYILPADVLRVLDPVRAFQQGHSWARCGEISGIDRLQMERQWPLRSVAPGPPQAYAVIAERTVRFNRPAQAPFRLELDYMQVPPVLYDAPGSVPREPLEYRYILADIALYFLLIDKDDARANGQAQAVVARLQAMRRREQTMGTQIASDYAALQTRQQRARAYGYGIGSTVEGGGGSGPAGPPGAAGPAGPPGPPGSIELIPNSEWLRWQDVGGMARNVMVLGPDDVVLAGPVRDVVITADRDVVVERPLRANTGLHVAGASEVVGDLTVHEDLIVAGALTAPGLAPVGPDEYVLTADAASPGGMKWAPAPAGGGGGGGLSVFALDYRFNATTSAPPAAGNVRFNNAAYASVTTVWIHRLDNDGSDQRTAMLLQPAGTLLRIEDRDNADVYVTFKLTATPVDSGTYMTVAVVWQSGVGTLPLGLISVYFGSPAGSGGGVPAGGTTGQVLGKQSAADYDVGWITQTGGGGGAPTDAQYLTLAADPTLTAERVLSATAPLTLTPAAGAATLALTLPLTLAQGGTGATTAPAARTALDVFSKSEVQGGVGLVDVRIANDKYLYGTRPDGTTTEPLIGVASDNNVYLAPSVQSPRQLRIGEAAPLIMIGGATAEIQLFGAPTHVMGAATVAGRLDALNGVILPNQVAVTGKTVAGLEVPLIYCNVTDYVLVGDNAHTILLYAPMTQAQLDMYVARDLTVGRDVVVQRNLQVNGLIAMLNGQSLFGELADHSTYRTLIGRGAGNETVLGNGIDLNYINGNATVAGNLTVTGTITPSVGGSVLPSLCEGRLTLQTNTPVPTADVTGASQLYFTPFRGNRVALYSGSAWAQYTLTQRQLTLSGLVAGRPYDVFLYDNAGTLTLELGVWSNDTTRSVALVQQDGVWVKTGALTRRYVGTIYTTSTTTTEDSAARRYVWNAQNRVQRHLLGPTETANSWTYASTTIRQANANAANQLNLVVGLTEDVVQADVIGWGLGTGIQASVGIGLDSTTVNAAPIHGNNLNATFAQQLHAAWKGTVAAGRHFLAWLEWTDGASATFYGDNNTTVVQTGIIGTVFA